MNPAVEQTLKDVCQSSFETKVGTAKEALSRLARGLHNGGVTNDQIKSLFVLFTRLFVSGDKSCSREEYELFHSVTESDMTYDEFYEMTNGGSDAEFVEHVFDFISILNRDDRIALIIYGACLVSADGVITYPEAELVDRILECKNVQA